MAVREAIRMMLKKFEEERKKVSGELIERLNVV